MLRETHRSRFSPALEVAGSGLGEQPSSPLRVTCGRRPGKNFLTLCSIGRVRSRVRPVDAAGVAAGPNALRGSGPKQSRALRRSALTQTGSPDPRNDRICIMSSCPRQLVLPIYLLACLMPPATASAPYIFRLELEEVVRQLADRLDHAREGSAEYKMILRQM